jgi:hypothetical protein
MVTYTASIEAKCAQELLQAQGDLPLRYIMRMKRYKLITWIVALLVCLLFPAIGNCQSYQVKLHNGRTMIVRQYYEKDGTIFLLRYGNYIGVDKSEVAEISKIEDPSGSANSNPSTQSSSGAKISSSRKTSSSRVKSSQAPFSRQNSSSTKTSSSQKASKDVVKRSLEPFKRLSSSNK